MRPPQSGFVYSMVPQPPLASGAVTTMSMVHTLG
jgi:hypothetical protein